MRRAIKVTLKFATAKKRRAINALLSRYRSAVNFFIASLWNSRGKLDKATLARLPYTPLSARYKSQALKQALDIVVTTRTIAKATGKPANVPVFHGSAVLDSKFVNVEPSDGSFDLIVRISSLVDRQRITVPTRKTAVANKWLAVGGSMWIQGCALSEDSLILWVEVPDATLKTTGRVLAVDVGINKLLSDSDGNHYGRTFKVIRDKILRSKPKSNARYRHYRERTNYINRTVNQLPWPELRAIGHEVLTDLKQGKKPNRSKAFRKAVAPWTYRLVLTRIDCKALENRVRPVGYDPRNTSRECPECGNCEKENRNGENFLCRSCGHAEDADTIGARNGLARTLAILGSVESPGLQRAIC